MLLFIVDGYNFRSIQGLVFLYYRYCNKSWKESSTMDKNWLMQPVDFSSPHSHRENSTSAPSSSPTQSPTIQNGTVCGAAIHLMILISVFFIPFFQSLHFSGALRAPKTTTENPKLKTRFWSFWPISVFECVIFSKIFENLKNVVVFYIFFDRKVESRQISKTWNRQCRL